MQILEGRKPNVFIVMLCFIVAGVVLANRQLLGGDETSAKRV